jgi:hypothetical protein
LTIEVSAARKPSSWVPPSWVLMMLAKVCTDSEYASDHCIATSTDIAVSFLPVPSAEKPITERWIGVLVRFRKAT